MKSNKERIKESNKKWVANNYARYLEAKRNWARQDARKKSKAFKNKTGPVWFGRKWEIFVANILGAEDMNKDILNQPYDLLWNGKKIDVKAARIKIHDKRYKTKAWHFSVENDHDKCDYFFLVCLINDVVERMYLLPSNKAPKSGISIFETTDKYKDFRFTTQIL